MRDSARRARANTLALISCTTSDSSSSLSCVSEACSVRRTTASATLWYERRKLLVSCVGGAIGEGAQVVAALHGYLADAGSPTL